MAENVTSSWEVTDSREVVILLQSKYNCIQTPLMCGPTERVVCIGQNGCKFVYIYLSRQTWTLKKQMFPGGFCTEQSQFTHSSKDDLLPQYQPGTCSIHHKVKMKAQ